MNPLQMPPAFGTNDNMSGWTPTGQLSATPSPAAAAAAAVASGPSPLNPANMVTALGMSGVQAAAAAAVMNATGGMFKSVPSEVLEILDDPPDELPSFAIESKGDWRCKKCKGRRFADHENYRLYFYNSKWRRRCAVCAMKVRQRQRSSPTKRKLSEAGDSGNQRNKRQARSLNPDLFSSMRSNVYMGSDEKFMRVVALRSSNPDAIQRNATDTVRCALMVIPHGQFSFGPSGGSGISQPMTRIVEIFGTQKETGQFGSDIYTRGSGNEEAASSLIAVTVTSTQQEMATVTLQAGASESLSVDIDLRHQPEPLAAGVLVLFLRWNARGAQLWHGNTPVVSCSFDTDLLSNDDPSTMLTPEVAPPCELVRTNVTGLRLFVVEDAAISYPFITSMKAIEAPPDLQLPRNSRVLRIRGQGFLQFRGETNVPSSTASSKGTTQSNKRRRSRSQARPGHDDVTADAAAILTGLGQSSSDDDQSDTRASNSNSSQSGYHQDGLNGLGLAASAAYNGESSAVELRGDMAGIDLQVRFAHSAAQVYRVTSTEVLCSLPESVDCVTVWRRRQAAAFLDRTALQQAQSGRVRPDDVRTPLLWSLETDLEPAKLVQNRLAEPLLSWALSNWVQYDPSSDVARGPLHGIASPRVSTGFPGQPGTLQIPTPGSHGMQMHIPMLQQSMPVTNLPSFTPQAQHNMVGFAPNQHSFPHFTSGSGTPVATSGSVGNGTGISTSGFGGMGLTPTALNTHFLQQAQLNVPGNGLSTPANVHIPQLSQLSPGGILPSPSIGNHNALTPNAASMFGASFGQYGQSSVSEAQSANMSAAQLQFAQHLQYAQQLASSSQYMSYGLMSPSAMSLAATPMSVTAGLISQPSTVPAPLHSLDSNSNTGLESPPLNVESTEAQLKQLEAQMALLREQLSQHQKNVSKEQ